jgi:beta-galactosidase
LNRQVKIEVRGIVMRRKQLFNDGWQFTKRAIGTKLEDMNASDVHWTEVEIPHDWLIYDAKNLYETGEGWYRKAFTMDSVDQKVYSICFEGVYMNTTVYVNGVTAGEWKYGYSSFEFDITKLLRVGENEIMVQVIHQSPNSRWYSGAGIYRKVWMKMAPLTHIVTDGIYISAKQDGEHWKVEVDTEVVLASDGKKEIVRQTILNRDGQVVGVVENSVKDKSFARNFEPAAQSLQVAKKGMLIKMQKQETDSLGIHKASQCLQVKDPILWSLEHTYLYTLKTEIVENGTVIDEIKQNFGFRTIRFDKNEGFFLNDTYIKLHGACMHHDLGALGAAMNKTALRRQLVMLKEMGINAVRTSHNMPAVEMMELADEMGILIVSEAFDMWERSKTEYDYARFFPEWHGKDVASWIKRDRNHPSIIMWSIGNEIYDTHAGERGREVAGMLRKLVEQYDPKKNGLVTFGSNYMPWENTQKAAEEVEVVGYNYAEYLYDAHHKKYPNWIIYGSETASTVQSRGIYHFPLSQSMLANDDEQCSSLGNCTTSWGAKGTQRCITDDRDAKFCLGQFIWTGFDYIGEPTPYSTKNSYFGQIDTAGFAKDSFYIYQSAWTDYRKKPMIHILPYWDFNEGQLIDVRVFSNAPKIELLFNGESLGAVEIDHGHGKKFGGDWQIPYQKGILKAVAYDENDQVIAVDEQRSFGDATVLKMEADKTELKADGQDLIFVTISSEDAQGNYVANANNRIEVEVSGAGRLVGLDNGSSTDYDSYKGTSKRLFSGKLLAIIAAKFEEGDIRVRAVSKGLKESKLLLKAVPGKIIEGVSTTLTENTKSDPKDEIPIRKINLINHGVRQFDVNAVSTTVTAEIYPTDATYRDLEWRVINSLGIDTNLAEIKVQDNEAVITAKGDGAFRLRCSAANGQPRMEIISELEFGATGLGNVNLNALDFISGGLYNASNCELGNGNERGVATLRDGESHIGFRNIDFGEFGSDEITMSVFYNSSDPLPIEIWEGMLEEEGSSRIDVVHYQAPARWNTYQENTFKLSRRIKGITTICFVLKEKIHLKGFRFTKLEKAYERLSAKDNTRIFGDSFQITEDAVEQIGNNVVLEYENMNFSEGFHKIVICGRSRIDRNTIHVRFHGENGDVNQIVEFPYSEEYTEKKFTLNSVEANQKVALVFLPGSKFDLKWFQFVK